MTEESSRTASDDVDDHGAHEHAPAGWRLRLERFVDRGDVQGAIIGLIVINAVTLGLATSDRAMAAAGPLIQAADVLVLSIFVIELVIKLVAKGRRFFSEPWNIFDFIVVGISVIPGTGPFQVLRAFRILRVLRLISMVPEMRRVVGALLKAIPGMGTIILVLLLIFYVFAVIATELFGQTFPQWFGTIGASLYSLFQIMTLESWSDAIVRPMLEVHPFAWAFFVPFILISAFAMLNLFIALIVNTMQTEAERERHDEVAADEARREADIAKIISEMDRMNSEMERLNNQLERGNRLGPDEISSSRDGPGTPPAQ